MPKSSLETVSHLVPGILDLATLLKQRRCGFAARLLAHGNNTVKRVIDIMVVSPGC